MVLLLLIGPRLPSKADFDVLRCSEDCYRATEFNAFPTTSTTTATSKQDPLSDFKKGIKQDPTLFTVLKDPKLWDPWHCSTMAQARAQDVSEVLDSSFVPQPGEELLFEAKQKYLYAVFERVLQTDKGKALV